MGGQGQLPTQVFWIQLLNCFGTLSKVSPSLGFGFFTGEIKISGLSKLPLALLFLGYTFLGFLLGLHFYKLEHSSAGLR